MHRQSPQLIQIALVVVAIASAPAAALARPGGPPGPPHAGPGAFQDEDGFFLRRGLTAGVGMGIGVLSTDSGILDCRDCQVQPAALGIQGHIGGMLDHRTALAGEYWAQAQRLDRYGDATGVQHLLMGSLQHWLAPQLWVKGGLGVATLQESYYDGVVDELAHGAAIMAAAGYEIAFAPDIALDAQLRLGSGLYRDIRDQASTALVGLGVSWF